MALKETEELLEIWRANNRFEWSDAALDIVKEILTERGIELPAQHEPMYERPEDEIDEEHDFSEGELRIIGDENPPDFYDPFDVVLITKQIDRIAKWMIVFTILYNAINYQRIMGMVQPIFIRNLDSVFVHVFAVLLLAINTAIGIVLSYFPLKALAHVLRILMEMEFRSRKAN